MFDFIALYPGPAMKFHNSYHTPLVVIHWRSNKTDGLKISYFEIIIPLVL